MAGPTWQWIEQGLEQVLGNLLRVGVVLAAVVVLAGGISCLIARMVLRSLKDRIRRGFNVSIAEVGDNDQWRSAFWAILIATNDKRFANQVLSKVVDFIEATHGSVVDDYRLSMI